MTHPNLEIIDRFFAAYGDHDLDALGKVVAEDVQWHFPGRNPLSGTKRGAKEVVAFFDEMGKYKVRGEQYVSGVNDGAVIEGQRTWSVEDGVDYEMEWCVVWKFDGGRIVSGTHFCADQHRADEFFQSRAAALG